MERARNQFFSFYPLANLAWRVAQRERKGRKIKSPLTGEDQPG